MFINIFTILQNCPIFSYFFLVFGQTLQYDELFL